MTIVLGRKRNQQENKKMNIIPLRLFGRALNDIINNVLVQVAHRDGCVDLLDGIFGIEFAVFSGICMADDGSPIFGDIGIFDYDNVNYRGI